MIENKKILIGVMHTTREPWLSIATKGQLEHWNFQSESNFEVIYFFSRANKFTSKLNTHIENFRWRKGRNASYLISYALMIICTPFKLYQPVAHSVNEFESKISALSLKINIPELESTMRWKKIAFLNYFLHNTKSDYVIMVTSSSILNLRVITEIINELDKTSRMVYAGPLNKAHDCDFVSGSFTIINKPAAKLLIDNLKLMPVHVNDDVAFGTAFKKLGIPIVDIKNLNINSLKQLENLSSDEINQIPHFRLKSGNIDNRQDILIMKQLTNRLGFTAKN
jgi:hypothetical protein